MTFILEIQSKLFVIAWGQCHLFAATLVFVLYADSIYTKGNLDIPEDLEIELDCNKYLNANPEDSLNLIDPSQFENPDKDIF